MTRQRWVVSRAGITFVYLSAALGLAGCGSAASEKDGPGRAAAGAPTAAVTAPLTVSKTFTKKVYVHIMPWFETNTTSGTGSWGIHWTMANKNPNVVDGTGKRQIASYYYPLIGPYGSGDPDVIEYQLLLMKYAGVDGVLIDWPGTLSCLDYAKNKQNADALVNKLAAVGLEFAIVYEDNNLTLAASLGCAVPDKYAAARGDMVYLRDNYFNRSNYIKINGAPLLLDFGPQTFMHPADWSTIFTDLPTKPTFLPLWYNTAPGSSGQGEFPWIYKDFTTGLQNFYDHRTLSVKFGVAYPGFQTYYAAGGWGGDPGWTLPYNGNGTFGLTLDMAKTSGASWIQLATWNDFGEGTMLEPTREFGYGSLTTLQQKLGVSYTQTQLELVAKLFSQRKQYAGNATKQAQLDSAFVYFVNLQPAQAAAILNGTGGGTPTNPPVTNAGFESAMTGWSSWSPTGTASAGFVETYNGGHGGSTHHLTHYSASAFETWTYQTMSGIPNGNYSVRGWVRKGGAFGFARLQAKLSAGGTLVTVELGTFSDWTQVETSVIAVTANYLEFGLYSQATSGSSFIHLDDVEVIRH